jgi:hypothetical protein
MIEYLGRVRNGVVIFDQPQPALEGRRVRVQEAPSEPVDATDGSFWSDPSLQELAQVQGVRLVQKLEEVLGGWPETDLDDGFESEFRRWRGEGAKGRQ